MKKYKIDIVCCILGLVFVIFLMTLSTEVNAEQSSHPNMFLNTSEIEEIKEKLRTNQQPWKSAYDNMISEESKWLNIPVQSVTFGGNYPPSGDIHDYYTDPPYLNDGIHNPNSDRTDYSALINASRSVRYLGIAYVLTGDNKYADKAVRLINAWTVDQSTMMNPKFTNGQSRIEISVATPGMFYGADLIWNYPGWNQSDKDIFKEWTRQMIDSAKTWSNDNNFENWRLVFISSASVITDDENSRQYAFDRWKAIIPDQVSIDGSMKKELLRTNSLTYSTFALNAMIQTAEIARHYNVDLYNYKLDDGRGLEKVLDFHVSYIVNPSTWSYKQISSYKGDNTAIYELAYSFKQKPSYLSVINRWRGTYRNMYEMRVMGPATLTHANMGFNLTRYENTTNVYTANTTNVYTVNTTNVDTANMKNTSTTSFGQLIVRFYEKLRDLLT